MGTILLILFGRKKRDKQKAIDLVKAYFDHKEILMKDPESGVKDWISVWDKNYWSFLGEFYKKQDKKIEETIIPYFFFFILEMYYSFHPIHKVLNIHNCR